MELTKPNLHHAMFRTPWATRENLRGSGRCLQTWPRRVWVYSMRARFQSSPLQNQLEYARGVSITEQPFMDIPDDVREFFRKQGRIGGKRRMKRLSPEERTEIARKAAQSRWADKTKRKSRRVAKSKANPKSNTGDSK